MMKIHRYAGVLLIAALSLFTKSTAQVTTNNTLTVEELVNQVLLGDGVNAFNITFNGMPGDMVTIQAGTFLNTGGPFLLQEGLAMVTGTLNEVIAGGGVGGDGATPNLQNDPDLVAIAGQNVNNCAIIEFDFTVNSDSVVFDYIFGSYEYPQYVCSGFNDVFAFLLSGPGINGPYSNGAKNIALIPNSDIPVAINTVNPGVAGIFGTATTCQAANPNWVTDSQYYVDNEPPLPNNVTLDGYTTVLRARSPIECGEVYHIKLAIANALDPALQSAVFLKKGSFTAAGEVFVNVEPGLGGINIEGSPYEGVIVAGCFSTVIELTRPEGAPTSDILVQYGGTATQGLDYILGPNDTLFAFTPGVDTLIFNIQTFVNPDAPDTLWLVISVIFESCSGIDTAFASIPIIQPYSIFTSVVSPVVVVCPAETTIVTAQGVNGLEPYFYDWGEFGFGQFVEVPVPPDQAYYYVNVNDPCGFEIITDSVLVINNIPPPLAVTIPQTQVPTCPGDPVQITALVSDGNPDYTFIWNPVAANSSNITVEFILTQMVYLSVIDICGTTVQDSVLAVYPVYDDIIATFDSISIDCPGDLFSLTASVEGGADLYTYQWYNADPATANPFSTNQSTSIQPGFGNTLYTLTVTDQCGESDSFSRLFTFLFFPVDSVHVQDRPSCTGTELEWRVIETFGGEPPFQYFWSGPGTQTSADTLTGTAVFRNPENEDYTLFIQDRCGFYFSPNNTFEFEPDIVFLDKVPNVITPNKDGLNDVFIIEGIQKFPGSMLEVFDRWGKSVFKSNDYRAGDPLLVTSGAFTAEDLSDGTYYYVISIDGGQCQKSGWLQVLGSNPSTIR